MYQIAIASKTCNEIKAKSFNSKFCIFQLLLALCLQNPHSTRSTARSMAVCLETPPIVFVVFWFIEAATTCQQFFQIWQTIGLSRAIALWPRVDKIFWFEKSAGRWEVYGYTVCNLVWLSIIKGATSATKPNFADMLPANLWSDDFVPWPHDFALYHKGW